MSDTELKNRITQLEEALKWALEALWDGDTVKDHNCGFISNPESGHCEFHEKLADACGLLPVSEEEVEME